MKNNLFPVFLVLFLLIINKAGAQAGGMPANSLFGRKYKVGERYRYKLTMTEYHDEKLAITNVSICELKVVVDSNGVPYDEVHWISKKTVKEKDSLDHTGKALSVRPYRISLDGRGRIDLPVITVPEMTEPIQDFNTFFVAVSPLLAGMDKLKKKGDTLTTGDPVIADFSNGSTILKGEDCILIHARVAGTAGKEVAMYTAFVPPRKSCLTYLIPEMNAPVVPDTLNNFQMVVQMGKDLYLVQYGREYFTIDSRIRKSDGKIVKAEMFNRLNLKMKINCDKEYKNCAVEMPFAERRILKLELLK